MYFSISACPIETGLHTSWKRVLHGRAVFAQCKKALADKHVSKTPAVIFSMFVASCFVSYRHKTPIKHALEIATRHVEQL